MDIYLPLVIFSIISTVIYTVIAQKNEREKNERILASVSHNNEYIFSFLNTKEERETKIHETSDCLRIETDAQLLQLTTEGNLHIKLVSSYKNKDFRGEFIGFVNPMFWEDKWDNVQSDYSFIIFFARNEMEITTLELLKEEYAIEYNLDAKLPAFKLKVSSTDIDRERKTIRFNGVFKDQEIWEVLINVKEKRVSFKGKLASLRNIANFPIYEI